MSEKQPPKESFPPLPLGQIHVWRASLERQPAEVEVFWPLLDDHEQSRAKRFHFDIHRRRFIVGRGVLRRLLGCYLGAAPQAIVFQYTSHGKPFLAPKAGWAELDPKLGRAISFNVSHSHELAVYAMSDSRRLGIDVEHRREMENALGLAERFFAAAEIEMLQKTSGEGQQNNFFRTWTRKEALLKATGEGLSRPLNSFDVTARDDASAIRITIPDQQDRPVEWSLQSLDLDDEYVAALAVEGDPLPLTLREAPF